MAYQQVVFDLDNVLVDTSMARLLALQETVQVYEGRTVPVRQLEFALDVSPVAALARLHVRNLTEAAQFLQFRTCAYLNESMVRLAPAIDGVLRSFKARGVPMAVVTSLSEQDTALRLRLFGLDEFFDAVIAAKTGASGLDAYLGFSEADPRDVLYVGATTYAEMAALSAGIDFAMAAWGEHDVASDGTLLLSEPGDLLRVVQTLDGPSRAALHLDDAA